MRTSFAAANTAVPTANEDDDQLKRVEKFLQSGFMRVDIFAASPVTDTGALEMRRSSNDTPTLASTFAVGESRISRARSFFAKWARWRRLSNRGHRVFRARINGSR